MKPVGKAQEAIWDHLIAYPDADWISINDMARKPAFRGIHYKRIQQAAKALANKGLIKFEDLHKVKIASRMIRIAASIVAKRRITFEDVKDIFKEAGLSFGDTEREALNAIKGMPKSGPTGWVNFSHSDKISLKEWYRENK